jgi:hypothetical protein
MSKLYLAELKIASAAAKGEYKWESGEGDHLGKVEKSTSGKKRPLVES